MPLEPDPIRDFADRVIRTALQYPQHLQGLLQQAVPELADGFDCQQARLLDREFPLDDWRRREADLPFEIPYRLGETAGAALVVVMLEHQSDTDPLMPLRLLYFAATYWDREWRQWETSAKPRQPLKLRPILPLVFYTGPTPWGSNRTLAELLDIPQVFHQFAPIWRPVFWNLSDQTPEGLLASANAWLQTLAVIRAEYAEATTFQQIFAETIKQLQQLSTTEPVRWYDLMRVVLTWAMWRRPQPERDSLLGLAGKQHANTDKQKEIESMTQKLGATMVDIAREEGQLIASRQNLCLILVERFGSLPDEVRQRIERITALERLQEIIRQGLRIHSLDELNI